MDTNFQCNWLIELKRVESAVYDFNSSDWCEKVASKIFSSHIFKNENLAAIQNSKNASHEIVGKWNSPAISLLSLGNIQTQWESNDTIRLDLTNNYIKVAWLVFQTVI